MAARVFVNQPIFETLPQQADSSCDEIIIKSAASTSNFKKLVNRQKLSLFEFLSKPQFCLFYKKQVKASSEGKNLNQITSRIRMINQTSDYNKKLFKQLQKNRQKKIEEPVNRIDSGFQCGNLARAYTNRASEQLFYLLLEQDTNTHGYTNWFFFRFRNKQAGIKRFLILNLVKKTAFYKLGMKISIFSKRLYEDKGVKWAKGGQNISFFQSNFLREEHGDFYNCLYFQFDFSYENDQVYFATCQPYTYTRMANTIEQLKNTSISSASRIAMKIETAGFSVANNIIPIIKLNLKDRQEINKKTLLFIGRQHPSQVAGSFITQYLMKFFLSGSEYSVFLLQKFNVLIIPMMNPDGVIYGNSRNNLMGFDLNRHWGPESIKQLTPQTHKIRSLLNHLEKANNNIHFLLDLHGHGKKTNSFLFCCKQQDRISNRFFSLIMSKLQQRFDIKSCTYGVDRDKQKTVRAQLYDIGIRNCYTLQNSYFGYTSKKQSNEQVVSFNEKDFEKIAQSIIKSLYVFFSTEKVQKEIVKEELGWNIDTINEQLLKIVDRLQREQKNMAFDQQILSDSDPEGDDLKLQERLNMYENNKGLGKKIRQALKKGRTSQQKNKSVKKERYQSKTQKLKTEPRPASRENSDQQEDLKVMEKKIQNKLILSKKLRTHNKIRASTRQRKTMLQTKRQNNPDQSKFVRKLLNTQFNPLQVPKQAPIPSSASTSFYTNDPSPAKTRPYDRVKLYQKLKTQINETHSFSSLQIEKQNERKQKMEEELQKLKQENLKNVVKQSLLFMEASVKSKRCRWVEMKKQKNMSSNNIIEASCQSFSFNVQNIQNSQLKPQQSLSSFETKKKLVKNNEDMSKRKSQPKKTKRSYQRFESFLQNLPTFKRIFNNSKGPVFYHFPVM